MPRKALIAETPQTDERNFPQWQKDAPAGESGHAYPKMLTRPCTEEDREEWLRKNQRWDAGAREHYYDAVAPKVGAPIAYLSTEEMVSDGMATVAGVEIVVNSPAEEKEVLRRFDALPAAVLAEPVPEVRNPNE